MQLRDEKAPGTSGESYSVHDYSPILTAKQPQACCTDPTGSVVHRTADPVGTYLETQQKRLLEKLEECEADHAFRMTVSAMFISQESVSTARLEKRCTRGPRRSHAGWHCRLTLPLRYITDMARSSWALLAVVVWLEFPAVCCVQSGKEPSIGDSFSRDGTPSQQGLDLLDSIYGEDGAAGDADLWDLAEVDGHKFRSHQVFLMSPPHRLPALDTFQVAPKVGGKGDSQ
eukprot:scaffold3946_cov41-Prasinocladus_malaysianus.AAC.1